MIIDFDYLSSIGPNIPVSGSYWGCAFDGQRLGLVGYALCQSDRLREISPGTYENHLTPMVFYAVSMTGVSISRAVRLFDQIALNTGEIGLTLQMKGALGRNEVFVRHIRSLQGRHGVNLFTEGQGRWFKESEVLSAVADDREEGLIRLAPEFQEKTERVMLDEEIALIDLDQKLTPLQEAFLYGLGTWSCKSERKKYTVGSTNVRLY